MGLTKRKKEILDFIGEYVKEHDGVAPSLMEIAHHLGIKSPSTVHDHLKRLREMGYLDHGKNAKRDIVLSPSDLPRPLMLVGLIAAGKPIESLPDPAPYSISEHLFGRGEHFLLKVVGDSMIGDGIRDGDLIVVSREEEAGDGEMVVALVNGEVTLKRLYREGVLVRLQPSNPALKPLHYPAREVKVQGVVVGLLRKYG